MTGMVMNLLLNILVVALLAVTIGYCWVLNRRIQVLQDSKSELAKLLKHFDESTQRASESIIALQTASKKIGDTIQLRIDKANYLLDDLAFMIDKGGKLADQLDAGFAVNRARTRAIADQQMVRGPDKPSMDAQATSRPEPRMESVVSDNAMPAPRGAPPQKTIQEKTAASLEAVLERVIGRSKADAAEDDIKKSAGTPAGRPRSRNEQELLELIKAGMKG